MTEPVSYRVRTFNNVVEEAKGLPPAIKLFGDLIYKNEVTILAGDTGVGKSLLAVDIAIGLAKGVKRNEPFVNDEKPLKVLYVDYELSDRQFYKRFHATDYPENLFRVDSNPECIGCGIQFEHIKAMIVDYKIEVVIIDNLTTLLSDSAKDAEVAIKIMKQFKTLQTERGITMLVLAHTPKRYENTPLRIEDVAGSKAISNYSDSIFFIAKSTQGKNTRYVKHVKQRNTEEPDGVYTLELKSNGDGLYFEYIGMSQEYEHLKEQKAFKSDRDEEIIRLYKEEGKTMEEIATLYHINKSTVSRIINSMK